MTLREALARATDSAGRIHSTRALALAIAEADALIAERGGGCRGCGAARTVGPFCDACWMRSSAMDAVTLCIEAMRLPASTAHGALVDAARALREERDVLRRESGEWRHIAAGHLRERDEARAEVERLRAALASVRPDVCREESIDALDAALSGRHERP